MTAERRPRIPAELAAKIDNARGAGEGWETPFEAYVRWVLDEHWDEVEIRQNGTSADWLLHQIDRWDGFGNGDGELENAYEEVQGRLKDRREKAERLDVLFSDDDDAGLLNQEQFDALYPTDEEKRAYFERMARRYA